MLLNRKPETPVAPAASQSKKQNLGWRSFQLCSCQCEGAAATGTVLTLGGTNHLFKKEVKKRKTTPLGREMAIGTDTSQGPGRGVGAGRQGGQEAQALVRGEGVYGLVGRVEGGVGKDSQ